MSGGLRALSRGVWVVLVLAVLSQISLQAARPLISYRLLAVHASTATIGVVAAAFALAPLLLALRMGAMADRGRSVHLLVGGAAGMTAACAAAALLRGPLELGVATAVLGLGQQGVMIGMQALLAQQREDSHDSAFGLFTAAISFGQLLGPLTGGFTLSARSGSGASLAATQTGLLVAAGCAAVAVPVALAARSGRPAAPTGSGPARRSALPLLRVRGVLPGLLVSLTVLSCTDLLGVYLPVLGEHLGIGPAVVGVLLAVRAATSMATRLFTAPLLRRFSRSGMLCSTAAVAAVCAAALPVFGSAPVMAVLMVGAGLGLGLGQPLTTTWIVRLVPPDMRGRALALRVTGNRLGQFTVPMLAGLVAGLLGAAPVFWLMGLLLAASAVAAGRAREALDPEFTPAAQPDPPAPGTGRAASSRG